MQYILKTAFTTTAVWMRDLLESGCCLWKQGTQEIHDAEGAWPIFCKEGICK